MKLVFSNQKMETDRPLPPTWVRVKKFLDGSKTGHLFNSAQVADAVKVTISTMTSCGFYYLPRYQYVYRAKKYWGKPTTILELKKREKQEDDRRQ